MTTEHHEIDAARVTTLEEEIAERLIEMAEVIGPDDTIKYVDTIAEQMRAEVDEIVGDEASA